MVTKNKSDITNINNYSDISFTENNIKNYKQEIR